MSVFFGVVGVSATLAVAGAVAAALGDAVCSAGPPSGVELSAAVCTAGALLRFLSAK